MNQIGVVLMTPDHYTGTLLFVKLFNGRCHFASPSHPKLKMEHGPQKWIPLGFCLEIIILRFHCGFFWGVYVRL